MNQNRNTGGFKILFIFQQYALLFFAGSNFDPYLCGCVWHAQKCVGTNGHQTPTDTLTKHQESKGVQMMFQRKFRPINSLMYLHWGMEIGCCLNMFDCTWPVLYTWLRGRLRTAWVQGSGWKFGCADGCGRRRCKGVGGNGWGEEAAGDERAGCADGCGRRGCKGVSGNVWGARSRWGLNELGCADGCGRRGCKGVAGNGRGEEAAGDERAWLRGRLRDGVGARLWLEMGWEKKPLGMSELGCADGCGREWVEMGGEKKPLGMSELGCAYGCGRRGCKEWLEMGGKKKPLGMSERTAWLQRGGWKWVGENKKSLGSGWKWVGRRSCWG